MHAEILSTMSDVDLVAGLEELVRKERGLTAAVLLHLAEAEVRGLHLAAACSSMHAYCTRVLGMSGDEAFKRIRAARAARRHPVVAAAIADGRVHLTAVVLLAPHLDQENAGALVAEASGKSKSEIEILLARRAPRADKPERLERLAEQLAVVADDGASQVVPKPPRAAAAKVAPLSPERFALQLTIGEATREKLLRAQALLRHQVPSGDLAELLDHALDALLDKVERRKFGKTSTPRAARPSRGMRTVPNEVRREAVARDGLRCSFVAADGRRCEETGFLELDHVVPVAMGGDAESGVRILCRAHNQYEAERILGYEAVEAGKAAKAMEADLIAGLRCMGVTASDARVAVERSRGPGAVEEWMRAALAALRAVYASRGGGTRCGEPSARYRVQGAIRHCGSGRSGTGNGGQASFTASAVDQA